VPLTVNAAAALNGAGAFATSRRGGLSPQEVRAIEAERARPRPTPWQALARTYGRPEIELRALLTPSPTVEEAWPLGECDSAVKAVIRQCAKVYGVTVQALAEARGNRGMIPTAALLAQTAAIAAVQEQFGLTLYALSFLFRLDKSCISARLRAYRAAGRAA
jgi:hypothetical protein